MGLEQKPPIFVATESYIPEAGFKSDYDRQGFSAMTALISIQVPHLVTIEKISFFVYKIAFTVWVC